MYKISKIISVLVLVAVLLTSLMSGFGVASAAEKIEDTVLWEADFPLGTGIALSSGAPDRWNRIYAGKGEVVADPYDSSNGVGAFTVESGATLSLLKGYMPFDGEFVLSSRLMIPSSYTGSPVPLTLKVGTNDILAMNYDSSLGKYRWTVGTHSGLYEMDKWVKIDIRVIPDEDAATKKDAWASCDVQVIFTGNIFDIDGNAGDKMVVDTDAYFDYNESNWGIGSNGATYEIITKAAPGGKGTYYLDDVRFYAPAPTQLIDADVELTGDRYFNEKLDGKVTLTFNHDFDVDTFDTSTIRVTDSESKVISPEVKFDKTRPNILVFDFANAKMSEYETYTVSVTKEIADVTGRKISPSDIYSYKTKGAPNASPTPMPLSVAPAGGYIMPDRYNTGHITPRDELVHIGVKYPEFAGGGKMVITEEIAEKYNYVFEGFYFTSGFLQVDAANVTIRDFYINGDTYYAIIGDGLNTVIEDGEIEGTHATTIMGRNTTMRRLYLHDVYADFLKPVSNNVIESCYMTDAGTGESSYLAHADGLQFSGEREYFTNNIKILGNRIDMPHLPLAHIANSPLFCTLNFGDSRNVQMSYNWVNGGGFTSYVVSNGFSHTKVTLTNNYYGIGRRYGYYAIDEAYEEGGRLEGELTLADNVILEEEDVACAGSVVYYDSDRNRIYDLNDLEGNELTVMVNLANYTTREQNIKITAELVKNDTAQATKTLDTTVYRYTPTSEYLTPENITYVTLPNEGGVPTQYEKLINFPDLPRNVEKELTLTDLPSNLAGYSVKITVYSGSDAENLKEIRSDVLCNSVDDTTPDETVSGDVNSDGNVNSLDRAVIARNIAKWNGYDTINETASDVNGDSKVNALDRAFIARYIAKWSGYVL